MARPHNTFNIVPSVLVAHMASDAIGESEKRARKQVAYMYHAVEDLEKERHRLKETDQYIPPKLIPNSSPPGRTLFCMHCAIGTYGVDGTIDKLRKAALVVQCH